MPVLKVTTADGSHEVSFDSTSTLTLDHSAGRFSVSDVVSVETGPDPESAVEPVEPDAADGADVNVAGANAAAV